jgi:hypothetical protein
MRRTDTELAERVEQAFMSTTGETSRRGARTWISRLARLHPRSVSRILAGDLPSDRIEAVLDALDAGWWAGFRDREA